MPETRRHQELHLKKVHDRHHLYHHGHRAPCHHDHVLHGRHVRYERLRCQIVRYGIRSAGLMLCVSCPKYQPGIHHGLGVA
ncbi:hypothetical protein KCU78_g10432, partial [Aureobasidium melanogenum]